MKKPLAAAFALVLAFAAWLYLKPRPYSPVEPPQAPVEAGKSTAAAGGGTTSTEAPRSAQEAAKPASLDLIQTRIPPLEQIRDEIRRNPHGHPASLIKFSKFLSRETQLALKDLTSAPALYSALVACANKVDLYPAVRTSCAHQGLVLVKGRGVKETPAGYLAKLPPDIRQYLQLILVE